MLAWGSLCLACALILIADGEQRRRRGSILWGEEAREWRRRYRQENRHGKALDRVRGNRTEEAVSSHAAGDANHGNYPFMVSLQDIHLGHFCGGSLVAPSWVLTSAYCLDFNTPPRTLAVAGASRPWHASSIIHSVKGVQGRWAKSFYTHPEYMRPPNQSRHNMGLVRVEKPFKMKLPALARLARLPPSPIHEEDPYLGDKCTIVGWGVEKPGDYPKRQLQQAELTAVSLQECENFWNLPPTQNRTWVCLLSSRNTRKTCYGDSGGPLLCAGRQVGVLSFVERGCNLAFPTLVLRIDTYLAWIHIVAAAEYTPRSLLSGSPRRGPAPLALLAAVAAAAALLPRRAR